MRRNKNEFLEDKISSLKQIMPEVFADGKLDIDELEKMFNGYVDDTEQKYKFEWWEKTNSQRLAYIPVTETLIPNKQASKNFDETKNLYIEGDNLEIMKILRDSYANKVKVIYIDPPYNTGNEFIYEDDFKEPLENYKRQTGLIDEKGRKTTTNQDTIGSKHTNWLNMMYPRLLLARDLLTEDGVVFISIDDIELPNMRKICDEIFGAANLISNSIRVSNSAKNNAIYVSDIHDYTLIYAKNKSRIDEEWEVPKNNVEEFQKRARSMYRQGLEIEDIEKELKELVKYPRFYDFDHYYYCDGKGVYRTDNPGGVDNGNFDTEIIHPITKKPCKKPTGGWRYKESTIREMERNNEWHFGKDHTVIPTPKRYLEDYLMQKPTSVQFYDSQIDSKRWKEEGIYFDFPKPVEYIKQLLRMSTTKNCIVMDFFSGSATTAEAVMQLNAEDGGTRRFIMVQIPEDLEQQLENVSNFNSKEDIKKNIKYLSKNNKPLKLTELGKERISIAGDDIIEANPKLENKLDIGFRVFEYAETSFPVWDEQVTNEEINKQFWKLTENDLEHDVAIYEVLMLLKTYELTDTLLTLDKRGLYHIGDNESTLVFLGKKLESDIFEQIIVEEKGYYQIVIYDNSFIDDSQKQNMIARIGHQKLDFI